MFRTDICKIQRSIAGIRYRYILCLYTVFLTGNHSSKIYNFRISISNDDTCICCWSFRFSRIVVFLRVRSICCIICLSICAVFCCFRNTIHRFRTCTFTLLLLFICCSSGNAFYILSSCLCRILLIGCVCILGHTSLCCFFCISRSICILRLFIFCFLCSLLFSSICSGSLFFCCFCLLASSNLRIYYCI